VSGIEVLQLLAALGVPLFGLGSFLFLWLMRRPMRRAKRYVVRGGFATGTVVGHVAAGHTDSSDSMYADEVEFVDRMGRVFRIVSSTASTHPTRKGTPVDVAYDVDDPRRGMVIGAARYLALAGTLAGTAFALLAIASAICFLAIAL
jgi:hypothetical protein